MTKYMTVAMRKAPSTSRLECCFKNMVEVMIRVHIIKDNMCTLLFLASDFALITAK